MATASELLRTDDQHVELRAIRSVSLLASWIPASTLTISDYVADKGTLIKWRCSNPPLSAIPPFTFKHPKVKDRNKWKYPNSPLSLQSPQSPQFRPLPSFCMTTDRPHDNDVEAFQAHEPPGIDLRRIGWDGTGLSATCCFSLLLAMNHLKAMAKMMRSRNV
jgi:hypothetical protein